MRKTKLPKPVRSSDESDKQWRKRATAYIRAVAPATTRHYVIGGNRKQQLQRWFIPSLYFLAAFLTLLYGFSISEKFAAVNGPDGARGTFNVVGYASSSNSEDDFTPNISLRGKEINVYNSAGKEFSIGRPIDILYSTKGAPVAAFAGPDGKAHFVGYPFVFGAAGIFTFFGFMFIFFHRGRVDYDYVQKAIKALEAGKPLPKA